MDATQQGYTTRWLAQAFLGASSTAIPMLSSGVSAGFPFPTDSYCDGTIDLNTHLIINPSATFIVRAAGESMRGAGIFDGDELIVDRSLPPAVGKIVIAIVDGDFTVKRLSKAQGRWVLRAENPATPNIVVAENQELSIWGVVTRVLHRV